MNKKTMSRDNKLSWTIIGLFFLFLLLMGTSSCSRSGGVVEETKIFNKGKQAVRNQYVDLNTYLVSFEATVEGKSQAGSKIILAYSDGIALSHYRAQVIELLGYSKIESLSFNCNEFEHEALIGADVKYRREFRE